jgi:Zn-finger nucleic acid-binding protein
MKCPTCNIRLMPANRGPVAIDFCPSCWGIWLDRGELDAIVSQARRDGAREASTVDRPPASVVAPQKTARGS